MGIYLKLKFEPDTSFLEIPRLRLDYGLEVSRYFGKAGIFYPENIEIWLNGTSESLGGRRVAEIRTPEATIDENASRGIQDRFILRTIGDQFYSVVLVNGVWTFGKPERYGGYVSINNNPITNQLYHDISLEIFPKGGNEDLVDLLWDREVYEPEGVIPEFATHLRVTERGTPVRYSRIMFSVGPPTPSDIGTIMAVNTGGEDDLIGFMYDTMQERREPILRSYLSRKFVLDPIRESHTAREKLHKNMEEAMITVRAGGSTTFVAKGKDSFEQLYKGFVRDVFTPLFQKLPKDQEYRDKILRGLGEEIEGKK